MSHVLLLFVPWTFSWRYSYTHELFSPSFCYAYAHWRLISCESLATFPNANLENPLPFPLIFEVVNTTFQTWTMTRSQGVSHLGPPSCHGRAEGCLQLRAGCRPAPQQESDPATVLLTFGRYEAAQAPEQHDLSLTELGSRAWPVSLFVCRGANFHLLLLFRSGWEPWAAPSGW